MKHHTPIITPSRRALRLPEQAGISLPALLALRAVQVLGASALGALLLAGAIALRLLTR